MRLTPIEATLLSLLADAPIRGTSSVGYALWPDRTMQAQGAALAAGRILSTLRKNGLVFDVPDAGMARYEISAAGHDALTTFRAEATDPRQLSLLD